MKRDLEALGRPEFDILVVGGGIYGACVAWEATQRGFSVALIEKDDFGQATSANSMRVIHGSLRYLQDGRLERVRLMVQERRHWLLAAPHLVRPLPFVVPTGPSWKQRKATLAAALFLNELLSLDRNNQVDEASRLPTGRLTREAAYIGTSALAKEAALWHDAFAPNSERLLISVLQAAEAGGAIIANYVEATDIVQGKNNRTIIAADRLGGRDLGIAARIVVLCAGVWTDSLLSRLRGGAGRPRFVASGALNLITRRFGPEFAIGAPVVTNKVTRSAGLNGTGMIFALPWSRDFSLVGTWHVTGEGLAGAGGAPEGAVRDFVAAINRSFPAAALTLDDIRHIHWGFLPLQGPGPDGQSRRLLRDSHVHDHEVENGVTGLISVVGVKLTTARDAAERAVALAGRKLKRPIGGPTTGSSRVFGGDFPRLDDLLAQARQNNGDGLTADTREHLARAYGTSFTQLVALTEQEPAWRCPLAANTAVIGAEVIYAVRETMAHTLEDVVRRRTVLGMAGLPDEASLDHCSRLMAAEAGWDDGRRRREVEDVRRAYRRAMQ
jgi:glycerol-3-phosphate dehydrogenase